MKHLILLLALLQIAAAAEPLRIFIRSGPKTHGPGCHDYPAFLKDWTVLLNARGAKATGGNEFPTKEQLAETDVVILHAEEAGNIKGDDRANFEAYLKRGGGVVAIHGGTVSRDPDWYKTIIGGSWNFDHTKFLEDHLSLYFTDKENPITEGASNFDIEDEIYYDMDLMPDVKVLAAAYTPKPKKGAAKPGAPVSVYDIQPQIWTYETGSRRAFACIPGHVYENFSHISLQTILLRGIAWAGKMEDADAFLKDKTATESALRYPVGGPTRPEDAAAKIEVHPEFDISLVAAEPLINKAMNIDWDEKGRMWVVESPEYPNGLRKVNTDTWKDSGSVEKGKYEREPLDRISILTDTDGDGMMDKKHVFADKLELATSFVLHKNGVIVSAAPDIWFLEDTDGDEVADKRTKLYTGLGTGDTHAVMNNLRWGLDGWVYATHGYSAGKVIALGSEGESQADIGSGVVRFKPDGTKIEMVSSKGGNTWGLTMTSDGQCFWTQPTSGTVLFHTVLPEYVLAKGKITGTGSFKGMITGQKTFPLMSWEQAAYKQIDYVGSYTAAAGCAIYEGGAWPEKWDYSYFVGEPTINIVSHYFVKPDGVTYTAEKEKGREETEFIRSKDLWFRPIENRVGPDGALYVVDFYNQAVIHNDTRGPLHGPANAAVRPDRDHYFGRIWRIQHKDAKKITVPVIDKTKPASLEAAIESPNAHTRMTAIRLMRETGEKVKIENGSAALKTYREFEGVDSPDGRAKLISRFAAAQDDWMRSALIAAGAGQAAETIVDCLASSDAGKLVPLVVNLLPAAMGEDPSAAAGKLIIAAAAAPAATDPLKAAIVDVIAGTTSAKPPLSPELSEALAQLVANPATATKILPLIARWDKDGKMESIVAKQVVLLSAKLADSKTPVAERIGIARILVSVGTVRALVQPIWILTDQDDPIELKSAIIQGIGPSGYSSHLVNLFNDFNPQTRGVAFDEIVKRPETAYSFLSAVEEGRIKAALISPGDIARLRSHPDKEVSKKANAIMDKLMPGGKEKEEIIKAFLPVVTKPGDAKNGELLFTAACAVCHKLGDAGADVGPALTGMGSHGAAELLVHIVDPNREVDPSFWQWNITTKDGKTLAGNITSENQATLNLRNQGGDTEIRKDNIANRQNTRRSLMPEGLDGLGAENIRDILAYMTAGFSDLPPDSTSATGLRFREPKAGGALRVLLVGAGSSHNFPRDFIKADSEVLSEIPGADVIGTMNLAEALENMHKADVLVFSGNHDQWGTPEFQKALHTFADEGKGIVLLHAATWSHPWEGYNKRFVAGETKGHGKGTVAADCIRPANHPVLNGVPETFAIADESYHFAFFEKEGHTTLVENKPDGKSKTTHPALWIVKDPKTRIVAYTHGHDDKSHANPAYQTILRNAVKWVRQSE
jgi:putative membrane-bound dehydrogenase-like protein